MSAINLILKLELKPFNLRKDAEKYEEVPEGKMLLGLDSEGCIFTFKIGWKQGWGDNYYIERDGQEYGGLDVRYVAVVDEIRLRDEIC